METGKLKLALSAGALALSMALAGCGGGGSSSSALTPAGGSPVVPPAVEEPSAYETAQANIEAATTVEAVLDARNGADVTAEEANTLRELASARIVALVTAQIARAASDGDAQKAVDDVKDDVTATEGERLQGLANMRKAELATQALVTDAMSKIGLARTAVDELTEESDDDAVAGAQEKIAEASTAVGLLPAGQQGSYNDQVMAIQNSQHRFVIGRAIQAAEEAMADLNIAAPTVDQIGLLTTANEELDAAIMALSEGDREEYAPQLANFQRIATLAEGVRAGTATAETLQGRITGLNDDLNAANAANAEVAKSGAAAEDALEAYTKAEAAEKSAADAIKELGTGGTSGHALGGTLNVKGDSAKAEEYAQKIFMAVSDLEAQETAVENAVKAIEEAIKAFEDLDPNEVVNYDDRLKSLQDDLRSAKGHQTSILAINLDGEEYRVESQSGDRKPSAFADYVAEAIQDAFDAEAIVSDTDGEWLRPLANGSLTATQRIGHTHTVDSDQRKDSLKPHGMLMSTAPEDFTTLPGLSNGRVKLTNARMSDFTDHGVEAAEDSVLTPGDVTTIVGEDTRTPRVVTYKGVVASLTCDNATCASENGVLTGPWYLIAADDAHDGPAESATFVFSSLTAKYREVEGVYRLFEGGYVEYGYWLQETDDTPYIVTFASSTWDPAINASITLTDAPTKAKYEGKALGIAVRKTFSTSNSDQVTSRRSGHFTADVELNADFTTGRGASLAWR